MRNFIALMFGLMALGCGGPGLDAPVSGPPTIGAVAAEDQTCSRDSECVLVQDCCGCTRAGRQLAVHRDRVEALSEAGTAECAQAGCVVRESEHRSCQAQSARCLGGRCIPALD